MNATERGFVKNDFGVTDTQFLTVQNVEVKQILCCFVSVHFFMNLCDSAPAVTQRFFPKTFSRIA